MINKDLAIQIAQEYISEMGKRYNEEFALFINEIKEFDLGWIFYYQSKMYIDTGDIIHFLVGNAPIVISKTKGVIYETGTANPVESYMEEIRSKIIRNEG